MSGGNRQFTMSATYDVQAKKAYLDDVLAPVTDFLTIECVEHGDFMHDNAKRDRLQDCYKKYELKPEETIWLMIEFTTNMQRLSLELILYGCVVNSLPTYLLNYRGSLNFPILWS